MSFFADYHMHTHLSPDAGAESTCTSMADAAIRAGLAEICITEHCECTGFLTPTENLGLTYDRPLYLAELAAARERFGDRIGLPAGVEIGQAIQNHAYADEILANDPYDFVIGSVHAMRGRGDVCFMTFQSEEECMAVINQYLDELIETAETTEFDVMGHVDYPLRYMRGNFDVSYRSEEERFRYLLHLLAEKGRGIEINTKVLRGDSRVDTQQNYLLRTFREEGGEILTVGSDAHYPRDVAAGVAESYALARACGFDRVATFRRHQPEFHRI